MTTHSETRLSIRGLEVRLPGGAPLLAGVDLEVRAGEIVAVLGPSGSGKSTLLRALFEPVRLGRQGFSVRSERLEMAPAALVPQQGAALDHLTVLGNVRLAWRWLGRPAEAPEVWLERVGLAPLAGARADGLSGGQRQRLAVARALAAGRTLLVLDEPSAGLDAHATEQLAALLRAQAARHGAGVVLVTHDPALVSLCADRALFLDPSSRTLEPLALETPAGGEPLEVRLRARLAAAAEPPPRPGRRPLRALAAAAWQRTFASLEVPARALAAALASPPRTWPELGRVALRVARQTLLRPAPFYATVSTLLGFTILYVLVRAAPAGVGTKALLEMVGGLYVLALAPPLSALLFVSTSGAALCAWLGSLQLGGQASALAALGIPRERYLWLPAFVTASLAFLVSAALVCGGLVLGGALLHWAEGAADGVWPALATIAGDLVDPVPERARLWARAVWLLGIYGPGIAADVIARGSDLKVRSDDVTRAMTGSVVASTLWVVALELGTALLLFHEGGGG
jgi:ABC-type nitrate/sulfonate/bicarbonate transport system ATPase subunit/ABC-type transporter Mla maintaining outer membrane lipid asymmetry permease subunit MlaE